MHDGLGHHVAAIGLADALVAQADAQDGRGRAHALDDLQRDTGFVRGARTGRDDDAFRRELLYLVHRQRIIAHHHDLGPQRLQVLHEVVGEAVVVVEHQEHRSVREQEYSVDLVGVIHVSNLERLCLHSIYS